MTTLTEILATVVVQSSAVALSHFGVTLEPPPVAQAAPAAAVERVVARTPRGPTKLEVCPKPVRAPAPAQKA